jgi:hypothetical protein
LIGWWPGDGNADDIVGGNDGTLVGGTGYSAGMVDQAFSLDETYYVGLGTPAPLDAILMQDFTIDAWVKFNAMGGSAMITRGDAFAAQQNKVIFLGSLNDGRAQFWVRGDNGDAATAYVEGTTSMAPDTWYHLAAVRQLGSNLRLYVNGVEEGAVPDNAGPITFTAARPLAIGTYTVGATGGQLFPTFNGKIDEVEVFDRALSEDEIYAIFAAGSAGKCKLASAQVWVGLKNSDDQGTSFDIRAALYVNDELVAEGETRCVTGITRNPARAKLVSVPFLPLSSVETASGDVVSMRVSARIGTNPDDSKCPGHNNATGLRLYHDSVNRASGFRAAISPDAMTDYFLHSNGTNLSFDALAPTSSTAKAKDSGPVNFAGGNPFVEIGTWTRVIP